MMDLNDKHTVVVGLARSGIAVARFLKDQGAHVTLTDQATEEILGAFAVEARQMGVDLELGRHEPSTFQSADLIVISPGVPHTISPLVAARSNGIRVIGEVELAAHYIDTPIVAVSGTNGKTTTTELIGRMLAASGRKVFVGGNIGNPLIEIAGRSADLDVIVAEISSFQLDTIETFCPHVAVLLNISPDHLDRYADFEAYAASKSRLFENQEPSDFAVCNGNDPLVQQLCKEVRGRVLSFYARPPENGQPVQGAIITPKQVAVCVPEFDAGRIDLEQTTLIGPHNRENIAAATLAALAMGASIEGVQKALDHFQALSHRLEMVGTVNGVTFINDSKATNVDAVMRALECFEQPVVLIMGGRNKGYDFDQLYHHVHKYVKKLVVMGESSDEIIGVLGRASRQGAVKAGDMDQAVQLAYASANPGETVLLSPACASFDMYGSYAERGDKFRQSVGGLS
jgi:UDP-N-acetylmuramoylalanine--D-glutamate ligase